MNIKKYFQLWQITASNALQEAFVNRGSNLLFMIGKIVRLAMSLLFLFLIKNQVRQFAGYTTDQVIVFFLTYQFIDLLAQVFYRGVYQFKSKIRTGEFDFYLAKPVKPLFQALTGKPDINDALFILPTTALSIYLATTLDITVTSLSLFWYGLLLINALIITTALHIIVLALGVLTTETEGYIWLYRDLMRLARFPTSIYQEPFRFILFFLIPVGMMITVPTEVLLGLKSTYPVLISFLLGVSFLWGSLKFWEWSLKKYSSASS